jgi:transposase
MNKRIVKQVVGIDVAQNELVVTMGRMYDDWTPDLYADKKFENTAKGFASLVAWVSKVSDQTVAVRYVMEATGVYHESLAYFLDEKGFEISIVLPNKMSNYVRTLEVKTITDVTAAQAIARFGLERTIDRWKRPKETYKKLRQLTRERSQVIDMRTMAKNQLHAEQSEAEPNASSISRVKSQIALFNKQEKQIQAEIQALTKQDPELKKAIALMASVPGIGVLTAVIILAETNGFDLIRNKRQLSSYAGLDVKEKQSGTSVRSKPRISKKGNKYLRKAMYMPALTAIRSNPRYKATYERLISRHGIKMKAAVAIQRKLLEMAYTTYKTNKPFDKNYLTPIELEPISPNDTTKN